jgi:hypothetical protein
MNIHSGEVLILHYFYSANISLFEGLKVKENAFSKYILTDSANHTELSNSGLSTYKQ